MNAPVLTYSYSFGSEPTATFADLDLVRVLQDVETDEGEAVPAGTRGTVVAVYAEGAAYEVEFAYGTLTVEAAQLVAAWAVAIVESLRIEQGKIVDYRWSGLQHGGLSQWWQTTLPNGIGPLLDAKA